MPAAVRGLYLFENEPSPEIQVYTFFIEVIVSLGKGVLFDWQEVAAPIQYYRYSSAKEGYITYGQLHLSNYTMKSQALCKPMVIELSLCHRAYYSVQR